MNFTTITKKTILLIVIIIIIIVIIIGAISWNKSDNTEDIHGNKYLVEVKSEKRVTKEAIKQMLKGLFSYINIESPAINLLIKDVDVAVITYKTVGASGKPIIASGVVAMLPGTTSYDHLISIQHTILDLDKAVSKSTFNFEASPVLLNNVIVMADYEGYGESQTSDRQHPFLHLKSTGILCADMIEAAREYLKSKDILETSSEVELVGYSQGATSTIATLFELERRGQASRVRGVHSGGGAYDLNILLDALINEQIGDYPRMGYIPYLIRGMSYGEQVVLNDNKIYAQTLIDKGITKMFSTVSLSQWHKLMGTNIKDIMHPDFFSPPLYNNNSDILKLIGFLKKNSITEFDAPKTAVKLYHTKQDDFMPYSNAEVLKEKWGNATLIELTSVGHSFSYVEFLFRYMGLWNLMPIS